MDAAENCDGTELCQSILQALNDFPDIEQVVLFGSLAKGTARPDSDLDVAVEGKQPLTSEQKIAMIEALALACSRPVDLVDLRTAGQPLLTQIVTSGTRLKGSNTAWASLVYRNIIDNEDFVPLQQRILRARQRAWINS
ncbi:MAG: nucleotidyltransferase domain-containing protein [Halomonas sp.]|uniref:type VII toxin-antitoxin system MntA family adenylyltransferase antitoxin n=1 Tax=Halomonas sp. TaxID=1486246 RepID=UPI002ACDE623|nr:nucleotidyltransferase domain-containing protein [Halomonas sp.]MDZ7851256.1 nucleotidyltransferase domain-containing protein [Halomonas sp.]